MSRRQCSRSGCAERAVVSLTYEYGRSCAWLDELPAERDPHAYDLCARHARVCRCPSDGSSLTAVDSPFCRLESTGTEQF